ncbi:PriCT-2 domain-containing protein, partial [Marinagarivorans algicola]|uniref:PriCT-2 domain-containing protein n=1 Tax=Marinagarivorans algicola TaxID=1513270 RepID=UPI00192E34B2
MGQVFDAPTLESTRDALDYLDFNDRETWVFACFAIKSEFGECGFDVWEDWGGQYKNYRAAEARAVWRSDRGGKTGIGWLFARAVERGYKSSRVVDAQEQARLRAEREARLAVMELERAADIAWSNNMANVVAEAAADIVAHYLAPVGRCAYIGQKNITPYGALFPREPLVLITDIKHEACRIISGYNAVREYWDYRKTEAGKLAQEHEFSLNIGKGCLVLPMRTMAGDVRNLQVITKAAKAAPKKLFIKCGQKTGTYLRIAGKGDAELVTEGWATACTLHKATGMPVWVTWDCGGLVNFAKEQAALTTDITFLFCGDDDATVDGNPGKTKAETAAQLLGGLAVLPMFPTGLPADKDHNDFNDLQSVSGLNEVTRQVNNAVAALTVPLISASPVPSFDETPPIDVYDDYDLPAANEPDLPPAPVLLLPPDLEGCFKRYALIADDSQSKIWDSHAQKILKQKAVKDFVTPAVFKEWINDTQQRRTTTLASILPLAQKKAATVELGGGGLRMALERYVYLNPSQNVWDNQEREVVAVNDLRIAIAADYSDWVQHPERQEIKASNLVFDPTQRAPAEGYINR